MSIFLCQAVVTKAALEQTRARTEMQSETEMFEAKGAELSRQARHQHIARLTAPVTSSWTRILDHLTRPSREAQAQKDLLERLENMPAHMLKDIGVSRDTAGRFCHYNDYGMLVELAPATPEVQKRPYEVSGQMVRAAG
jgi:uncharacterized protein YjiS (DUF1127 family)